MKRHASLLVLGRNYPRGARFPQCDVTWTTLACVNDDKDILLLPNLMVWDTGHDIENKYDVDFYNINDDPEAWAVHKETHGRTFANQYCWMLADVSHEGSPFASVTLFGMGAFDEEYHHEVPYITYHLGYLRAVGVGITICQPSAILKPVVYGL